MNLLSLFARRGGLLAIALATFAAKANADQVTYFAIDDPRGTLANTTAAFEAFTATLSDFGVDDLESYTGFLEDPTLTFGSTGITAQTDFNYVVAFAALAVQGNNSLLDDGPDDATGDAINDTLTFNTPVTAFGTFISNYGDSTTANTISLLLENTTLGTSKTVDIGTLGPSASYTNVVFFGVTDTDPFDKITVMESLDFDGGLYDNITAGYVTVPEFGSFALVSMVLGGAILISSRVRKLKTC